MIQIINPENCCGCTACASICPHHAITMTDDQFGFKYPVVNQNLCVNCGLCDKVCSFNSNYDLSLNFKIPVAYGARHKKIEEVIKSRSGALFVAISDNILKKGGIIYGVGYKGHYIVSHKRATTADERDEFRGSKYVQSDLTGIFTNIKDDLKAGKIVMFVGTACQTAGLNGYIGPILRKNLLLVDIVCHGTPGPKIWKDYIEYLETQNGSKLINVNFRDKSKYGWAAHKESFEFENKRPETQNAAPFYKRIFFRESCGNCHFCNLNRPSDITIADFWGWEKQNPEINKDDKGLNLVLVNTKKGEEIFDEIKDCLNYFKADNEIMMQPNLLHPTASHPFREIFKRDYATKGFKYAFFHDYDNPTFRDRIRRYISQILSSKG